MGVGMLLRKFWQWVDSSVKESKCENEKYQVGIDNPSVRTERRDDSVGDGSATSHCSFYHAKNGLVVRISSYGTEGNNHKVSLYIIPNDAEDVRKEIADIISLEMIAYK